MFVYTQVALGSLSRNEITRHSCHTLVLVWLELMRVDENSQESKLSSTLTLVWPGLYLLLACVVGGLVGARERADKPRGAAPFRGLTARTLARCTPTIREFKKTTTATATATSLSKRFNEQSNDCAHAF